MLLGFWTISARTATVARRTPWSLTGIYNVLGALFGHAQSRGIIIEPPLKRLSKTEKPKGKAKSKPRCLTDEACGSLIVASVNGWKPMVATAVGTALLLSELLGLTWADVDLKEGTIHVQRQLSVARGKGKNGQREAHPATLVPLKTERATRLLGDVVPVELVSLLRSHKEDRFALGHAGADDFVFGTEDGKPLTQRNATRAIHAAGKRAKLNTEGAEPVSWHDLRHTAISRWIAAGLDVETVSRSAGHASPSITLDIYTHEFKARTRSADIRAKIAASGIGSQLRGVAQ
jgi:integrase